MTARIVFRITVVALLVYSAVTQKCPASGRSESSIFGWMLRGHVYNTLLAELPFTCVFKCREDNRCQSFNWVISLLICEFNNRTKEARPEDLIPNPERSYYPRDLKRVPLGSIQELPAETCDEIKRSEGQAVSGKYWFSTVKSGTSVLAYCNMNTNANKNCADYYKAGQRISGVYRVNPDNTGAFDVYCDQTTAGGGWTVFQKRLDGSVNFNRVWKDYKQGFGSLSGEVWLGLDKIHRLTKERSKLRVELEDFNGQTAYAEYDLFGVADEGNKYRLTLGTYAGTAGDSFSYNNGMAFSTKDQDNDKSSAKGFCAQHWKGGWWFKSCYYAFLNGFYYNGSHSNDWGGVMWNQWKGPNYSAKRAEMKIKPVNV